MSKRSPLNVLSHWQHPIANFATSAQDFYRAVEEALVRMEIPNITTSRVDWKEGGLFTARREYLRVERGRLAFDVCAAPFGSGYFFSWWLAEMKPRVRAFFGCGAALGVLFFAWMSFALFGFWNGLLMLLITIPLLLYLVGYAIREGILDWEEEILGLPYVGPVYEFLFRPITYYKLDTAAMFQGAVHTAVLEVIDGLTKANGLRALSEDERKPVLDAVARL